MRSGSWRSRMPEPVKRFYRHGRQLVDGASMFLKRMTPSQMTGRVFDLRQKRLVRLGDFGLYVMPNDYIGAAIEEHRTYEAHVERVIRDELREGSVFLDLGANLGYFSMLACSLVKDTGKVLAFEPNPQNLQLIYESKLHNRFANLTVYPYAVSDRSEILRFVTVGSNGGVVNTHSVSQVYSLLVQSVVLDQVLSGEPRIDLVKMDIEAHEPAALRGMEGLLRRHRPKLITEFHPWALRRHCAEPPEEYLRQLEALDYRLSIILPDGELEPMPSRADVMDFWAGLGCETVNLDMYAEPISVSAAPGPHTCADRSVPHFAHAR
jgi:FkbM family methyltransferase